MSLDNVQEKTLDEKFESVEITGYSFNEAEEDHIEKLKASIKDKADYNLRQIIGITKRLRDKVNTGKTNEYGDPIEDWDKVSTKDLIKFYTEGCAWDFYSSPVRLQAFIESSLADIVYKYEYNSIITSPDLSGTVQTKTAIAEMETQEEKFVTIYRKHYSHYIEEVLKSFSIYLHRVSKIIEWRQAEERSNSGTNPF